jgi:general secretion pathway protein A
MYAEYWGHFGLQRNPFPVSPNRSNFYSTPAHDEALLQLVSRIELRQGLMVLTGEAGTGKTIVLQYLLDWLQQYGYSTAYVFHPVHPFTELLQLILAEFGIPFVSVCKTELLAVLRNWLIDRHRRGDSPVILIDEAQALNSRTLLELRALLNLEIQGAGLVQVVLAGQPHFDEKLNRRKLTRFRERIMWHCTLRPLGWGETCGYIGSRLRVAGASESALLSVDAVREIFCYSKGVPRVINMLCEHALLIAYGQRRKAVHASDVVLAARLFDLTREADVGVDAIPPTTICGPMPGPAWDLPDVVAATEPTGEELREPGVALVKEQENTAQHEQVEVVLAAAPPEVLTGPTTATAVTIRPVATILAPEPARLEAEEMISAPPVAAAPPPLVVPLSRSSRSEVQIDHAPAVHRETAPRPPQVPVAHKAAPPPVARRGRSALARQALQRAWLKFARYWREVGRSFARDSRQFAKQCESWFGRPAEWNLDAARRWIAFVSTWLRQPAGTSHVGREHPRIPTASPAHK